MSSKTPATDVAEASPVCGFEPRFTLTPKIQRQLKAVERTSGFLEAVRLKPDWIEEVREFCNYLRAFEAIDPLRNAHKEVLRLGDLQNIHRIPVDGVRGGNRFAGQLRREEVAVGDRGPPTAT